MPTHSITICGLPGSGKTTFLAALWHLVTAQDNTPTQLHFKNINGDNKHLNLITRKWRNAETQEHTVFGSKEIVKMNLTNGISEEITLCFPDLSGEIFSRLWENRDCDEELQTILSESSGILLFVHADHIRKPQWILEITSLSKEIGIQQKKTKETDWHPRLAPTQVKLVDILQLLRSDPLRIPAKKLAIMLSAWDKVSVEMLTPNNFLKQHLPLLYQYLSSSSEWLQSRIYGISAQGGDYNTQAQSLREQDTPSERIQLIYNDSKTHDITEPLVWLMED